MSEAWATVPSTNHANGVDGEWALPVFKVTQSNHGTQIELTVVPRLSPDTSTVSLRLPNDSSQAALDDSCSKLRGLVIRVAALAPGGGCRIVKAVPTRNDRNSLNFDYLLLPAIPNVITAGDSSC